MGGERMHKKVLALVLVVALMATSLVGTVAANRGQTKKEYVDYVFDAVLANPVVTVLVDFPSIVIDGYRPPEGVVSCVVTINGEGYSYPEAFSYNENFHIEGNMITGDGFMEVTTVLTFNLPGHPKITESIISQVTGVGTGSLAFEDGTFQLTGTKMFNKVEGGGVLLSTQAGGIDYALHIGQMKGWPFGG